MCKGLRQKECWHWRTWEKTGATHWVQTVALTEEKIVDLSIYSIFRADLATLLVRLLAWKMPMFSMKRVVSWMYSIILHDCTLYQSGLSGASPRKSKQNLLKQNKYLLVHVSEKPMDRATIKPGSLRGSNVLEQCFPTERWCEPHASSLQHVINTEIISEIFHILLLY